MIKTAPNFGVLDHMRFFFLFKEYLLGFLYLAVLNEAAFLQYLEVSFFAGLG